MFIVTPSLGGGEVTDRDAAARELLAGTADLEGIAVVKRSRTIVDGLPGVVIHARAKHAETGEVLAVYQAVLFRDKGYYRMLGRVRVSEEEAILPLFEKMTASFRVR